MTSLSVRESEVIVAARKLAEHVVSRYPAWGKRDDNRGGIVINVAKLAPLVEAIGAVGSAIGIGEVLAAFREERRTCAALIGNTEPGEQDRLLLDWDQARERYARLLTEYAEGIGLSVRKAEQALGAHLVAFEAMEAAR